MDKTIEGALAATMILIPAGVTMMMSEVTPDGYGKQIVGGVMVLIGLVAIWIRANMKEKRVSGYVKRKVKESAQEAQE